MVDLAVGTLGFAGGATLMMAAGWLRERVLGRGARIEAAALVARAEEERERLLRDADVEARAKLVEAQDAHEQAMRADRDAAAAEEAQLRQRQRQLDRKHEALDKSEHELHQREQSLGNLERQVVQQERDSEAKLRDAEAALERVAGLTPEAAKTELVERLEGEARTQAASRVYAIEMEARRTAQETAQRLVAMAVQRLAGAYVAEKTVSVVELPGDDMKGRIIGREGRNIRAFEAATGADVIIDDTPDAVVVSTFDPVRRAVAKGAMELLVTDGRIHPARIEEVVAKAKEQVAEQIKRAGEEATFELGLHGVHPELMQLLGKLKFRTVDGQNLWAHAVETGSIAGMLAAELGLKEGPARRAGVLHDIGKAVEHEAEGDHAQIAANLARKYGERRSVVQAIRHHHDDEPPSVLAVLVQAADTLSKARPGARTESLDAMVQRLDDMEAIAKSFQGVEEAFALQAGNEVRVMVDYGKVTDEMAVMLSRDIAQRIEEALTYPGEVRITVIREARATEVAR